ncbi:MAG: family 43 glycosylhydrolase [Bacteroidota bacterium]|nr:family 43 glycosylhydrolase [Bacteroidota bacterium]
MTSKVFNIFFSLLFILYLQSNAQSFDQQGLQATYFHNSDFTDSIVTQRNANINFANKENWLPQISADNFSVEWKGYIIPEYTEEYFFEVKANGDFRLYINDSLIINKSNNSINTISGNIFLTKGVQYSLMADFSKKNNSESVCQLFWRSKNQRKEIVSKENLIPENAGLPPVKIITNVIGRDPFVTLGPDGNYYMIHTSCYLNGKLAHQNCWDNNDGLHLWKSADMKDWRDLGLIWSIEKDGTWQKKYDSKGRRPLWAPEIHYIKKNWYIVYSMGTFDPIGIQTGLLESISGNVEGPYKDVVKGPIVKGIDGSLFEDTDGKVYFLHDNCWIAQMNKEMNGFIEPFRQLKTKSGKLIGFEGPGMLKIKDQYYLFAAEGTEDMGKNSYDLTIAKSKNIYGPYSEHWIALRHGGHGTLFFDKKGKLWTTLFGTDDLSNVYITPALVRMTLEGGEKILPLRGNLRAKVILPTAEIKSTEWKYTFETPSANWNKIDFNENAWKSGESGFGTGGKTEWKSDDIWMRKTFNPGNISSEEIENLVLSVSHNDAIEIYMNGVKACVMMGFNKYSLEKINSEAQASIRKNSRNIIAVHCHKDGANQFVDAGIITWSPEK